MTATVEAIPHVGPHVKIITITPEYAKSLLERNNSGNRPLKDETIKAYSRSMLRQQWKLNGETIKFDLNGGIIDGQHRLAACVMAGVQFDTYAAYGLERSVMDTVDTNAVRSAADIFAMQGKQHTGALTRALRVLWAISTPGDFGTNEKTRLTPLDLEHILKFNPKIVHSVEFARSQKIRNVFTWGVAAALHYMMAQKDSVLADTFWEAVGSGASLREASPVHMLRERILTTPRMKIKEVVALAIKAWNYERNGDTCQVLRFRKGEKFPVVE